MKIAVLTSGRADEAPLGPVIAAMRGHGLSVITSRVAGYEDPAARYSAAATKAAEFLSVHRPDWLMMLGDRYEVYAAAGAAVVTGVPIAHIHGGETTLGSFDEGFRNAISQVASLHFVSTLEYGARLVAMGIKAGDVIVVGAPGLDNTTGLTPGPKVKRLVVTYHPATRSSEDVREVLRALLDFEHLGYEIVFTGCNADPGAEFVTREIKAFVAGSSGLARIIDRMDAREYLKLCAESACVVGNSSAGLIEVPTLEVPTVNIGRRQEGRLRGPSIYDVPCGFSEIYQGIEAALKHRGGYDNPHGGPGASRRIAEHMIEMSRVRAAA